MRVNVAIPEAHVNAPVLDAALEAVTRLNEGMLKRGEIPSFEKALQYGIKWRPEPPGAEHFDHGGVVMKRGWGDCDDLAPYHAATLRHFGEDKGARAVVRRSGPRTWHAVVRRSDGKIDDPSIRAGMRSERGVVGAALPLMFHNQVVGGAYVLRPQLALRPLGPGWQARADLPWHSAEMRNDPNDPRKPTKGAIAMATLHTAPVAHTALTGAIEGACDMAMCGGYASEEHVDRLCCIADAIEGADFDELEDTYGEEHARAASQVVGSFFSGLAHGLHAMMPAASKLVQFVPGVGPVASSALDVAHHMLPGGAQHAAHAVPTVPYHRHEGRLCFPATFE